MLYTVGHSTRITIWYVGIVLYNSIVTLQKVPWYSLCTTEHSTTYYSKYYMVYISAIEFYTIL